MSEGSRASETDKQPGQQSNERTGGVTIGNVEGGIHDSIIAGGDVTIGGSIPTDRTDEHASQDVLADLYNLGAIRDLLRAAFDTEGLRGLFYFAAEPELRVVPDQFAEGDSLPAMVRKAVRYCNSHDLLGEMLAEVAKENPRQYERFKIDLYTAKPE